MFKQLCHFLRKYFGISLREARGISVLLFFTLLLLLLPLLYKNFHLGGYDTFKADSILLDSLLVLLEKKGTDNKLLPGTEVANADSLFAFNPNEVSYSEMILLGFDPVIAARIMKYRNRKGRFHTREDLLKIYDLPVALYQKLETFITLPEDNKMQVQPDVREINPGQMEENGEPVKKLARDLNAANTSDLVLDINAADTSDLVRIYGIGPVLSRRIVKYRDLLGGYSNIDQLDDVYGLKDNALDNLKSRVYVDSMFVPERIRINFSKWAELVRHPYVDSRLASDILQLRSRTGFLEDSSDLMNIPYLTDSLLNRLLPYFEF